MQSITPQNLKACTDAKFLQAFYFRSFFIPYNERNYKKGGWIYEKVYSVELFRRCNHDYYNKWDMVDMGTYKRNAKDKILGELALLFLKSSKEELRWIMKENKNL